VTAPKLAFLGTPDAALPSLETLLETSDIVRVITRPDKPRGRHGHAIPTPVKARARERGIAVIEVARSSELDPTWFEDIDVAVVVAFGVLIPSALLELPQRGLLNVHFSLLPRWRGASPVVAAIAAGDDETGVTVMKLDAGLDTGPIVAARATTIGVDENGGALESRLADLGAQVLAEILPAYLRGEVPTFPQNNEMATHAPRIEKAATHFDFDSEPLEVTRRVRALAPRPGVTVELESGMLRLLAITPSARMVPAMTLELSNERVFLGGTSGSWELLTVQPAGGRPMSAAEWTRGWRRPPLIRR
jgi:methionyl-tRNA formyltransferase